MCRRKVVILCMDYSSFFFLFAALFSLIISLCQAILHRCVSFLYLLIYNIR